MATALSEQDAEVGWAISPAGYARDQSVPKLRRVSGEDATSCYDANAVMRMHHYVGLIGRWPYGSYGPTATGVMYLYFSRDQ